MAKASERKDNFVFYEDWVDAMNAFGLSAEQFRDVICAAVEYNRSGHVPTEDELDQACRMMFATMRTKMDKNASKYAERQAQASQAGKTSAEKRAKARNEAQQNQPSEQNAADVNGFNGSERTLTDSTDVNGRNEINESNRKERIGKDGLGRDRSEESTPKPPKGADAGAALPGKPKGSHVLTAAQQQRFDRWYAEYPHKVGKDAARRAWAKINPDDELTDVMIRAVQHQTQCDERFREQRFIPHPATWLNRAEWENEYGDAPQPRARNDDPYTDWTQDPDWKRAMGEEDEEE